MLLYIISEINLILSLVNNILDIELIEQKTFAPKIEHFKPKLTFQFIEAMF